MNRGNRCGHEPATPRRFTPPPSHKARPTILLRLGERLHDYYGTPQGTLPSLNLANGSDRQQRSERREACLIVLNALIHYLDLVTLRVGIPKANGEVTGLTVDFLVERTTLCKRRVERATRDLVNAGIIRVHPVTKRDASGSYIGKGAIRTVTRTLFAVFGLEGWLKHERDRAAAKRRKLRMRMMKRDMARRDMFTGDLFKQRRQPGRPEESQNRTAELTRLMASRPDLSIEAIFEMLGRRPQTPSTQPA